MANETRQSLIRLAKREQMKGEYVWGIRIGSIIFALLLSCIPIMTTGNNPFSGFATIINGSLSKPIYFKQTIKIAVPLLGCALAIAPCFKMRFWNIGGEGQITMGAIAASFFALKIAPEGSLPHWGLLLLMMLSAAIAGGIWALIPAYFKAKHNTNETLFTLMMNYIAIGIVAYLQGGPWEGRKGSQIIPMFKISARLPDVFGVHAGWIIILLITATMHIYMKYTKQGYEIAVIGDSENTAKYAGMNVGRIIMRTMFISGAICGIIGFIIASGANHTLYKGVANGVGFTSITVAWLSQLNAFVMILISFVLAILSKGSQTLQTRLSVPASVSEIVTGILLFCMLGCEFFINYKLIIRENPITGFCEKTVSKAKEICSKLISRNKSDAKEA